MNRSNHRSMSRHAVLSSLVLAISVIGACGGDDDAGVPKGSDGKELEAPVSDGASD